MLKVVTLCGSLRKASHNRILANALPALAPLSMNIADAPSFSEFPHYDFDVQRVPHAVETLANAIRLADGVIIVSPEYNWSIPGALKNAIDWLSRLPNQPFKDKPIALLSASTGPLGASRMQYHLRQALASVEGVLLIKPEVFVTFVDQKIDEAKRELVHEPTREIVKQQLAAFERLITRMSNKPSHSQ